uniref:Uncharacterized protein n=1 Tax=Strigamia maritima TaxID=126957 RepID=T1JJH2_STRMM
MQISYTTPPQKELRCEISTSCLTYMIKHVYIFKSSRNNYIESEKRMRNFNDKSEPRWQHTIDENAIDFGISSGNYFYLLRTQEKIFGQFSKNIDLAPKKCTRIKCIRNTSQIEITCAHECHSHRWLTGGKSCVVLGTRTVKFENNTIS